MCTKRPLAFEKSATSLERLKTSPTSYLLLFLASGFLPLSIVQSLDLLQFFELVIFKLCLEEAIFFFYYHSLLGEIS